MTSPLPSDDAGQVRFDALLATAVDGIIVINAAGVIEAYNPACARLFGFAAHEVIGQNVKMLMPEPYHREHDGYISSFHSTRRKRIIGIGREVVGQRKDGSTFPMYLSVGEGFQAGKSIFVGIIHDETERTAAQQRLQDMQQELFHVSRLGEMGQMASALAHELNQPLAAVTNYVNAAKRTLLKGEPADQARVGELLEKASAQTLRAGQIIRRLREFTEKSGSVRATESLNAVVEEAVGLALIGSADAGVETHVQLAPDLPGVTIDRIQIQQVILNLLRNAVDAMRNCGRRNLLIRTLQDGDFLQVQVTDSGPGLAPEVAERLFQPFVSTKKDGMGIGLSICHSIVDAHHGRLWVTPNDDTGVTFRFNLPIAHAETAS